MAESAFKPIFDGRTLAGWHATPRLPVPRFPGGPEPDPTSEGYKRAASTTGKWTVEDGAITGRQEPLGSGLGGYIVSDGTYGDFELQFEARPDWPADTGILVRTTPDGTKGYQILLDHRQSGNIGGYYGNGIGGFHAIKFTLDVKKDANGKPVGLVVENPATSIEQITPQKIGLLEYGATGEEFLKAWQWDAWNSFLIRVEGASPRITVQINGALISIIDTAAIVFPDYDAGAIRALLGPRGHIAFEVHDNDPGMGEARWGKTAACRWRNVAVREL